MKKPQNNYTPKAWVAVEEDNTEVICDSNPYRFEHYWDCFGHTIDLPQGSIKKLIGRELTWSDEPVELK